jgi:Family of unknown function (DUF6252)
MRILLHIFLLSLLVIGDSCKKKNNNDDELPPLTFEGNNTIGCKMDGTIWVPKGISSGGGVLYPVSGGYYGFPFYPGTHFRIRTNDPGNTVEIFLRNYSGSFDIPVGVYYMNKNTQSLYGSGEIHSYGICNYNGKEFITDSLRTGKIEILKSDRQNGIVSGRFEFDAYNSLQNNVVKITEGRFDVK